MRYLDANVFLYYILDPEAGRNRMASKNLLMRVAEGSMRGATSVFTWDEIVWAVKKKVGLDIAKTEGAKFLKFPSLILLEADEAVLITAQSLVEGYGMRPRDAIHAACCIENGIDEIITNDPDFDRVEGLRRISLEDASASV